MKGGSLTLAKGNSIASLMMSKIEATSSNPRNSNERSGPIMKSPDHCLHVGHCGKFVASKHGVVPRNSQWDTMAGHVQSGITDYALLCTAKVGNTQA